MASRYITFRERDLGGGIDQESAENNIPQGFCEDLLNMDPKSQGPAVTRKGYQGYLGYLPVRVRSIDYTTDSTDNLCLTLDTSIDVSKVTKSPLIIYGRTSVSTSGDFTSGSDSVKYYSGFTTNFRKTFNTGTNTIAFAATEHLSTTNYMFVRAAESTSLVNNNNRLIELDDVTIDSSNNIDLTFTNNTGSSFEGFTYILENDTVAGTSFRSASTAVGTGTNTYTITAATHGLTTSNILVDCYEEDGTDLVLRRPQGVVIKSNGNVEITFANVTAGFNARFLLRSVSTANVAEGTIANNQQQSIQMNNLSSPYLFVGVYLEDISTGDREQILPDSITTDEVNNTASVSFTNNSGSGKSFSIYYVEGQILTNRLCVTATSPGSNITDTAPQLTIYGLNHSEIYNNYDLREGWVNLIDSYRSLGEDRIIAGLGGNLFRAALRSEPNNSTNYLMPLLYPNLRGRTDADLYLGPVFFDDTDTPSRSRGYIKTNTAGNNFVVISEAEYQTSTGQTRYRLLTPNQTINGTLSTIISTTSNMEDRLTVAQMGYSRLNGQFKIKSVTNNTTSIDIFVDNPNNTNNDADEVDAGGLGGIFTDRIVFSAATMFQVNDLLNDQDQTFLFDNQILAVDSATVLVNDITSEINLPGGLRLVGKRTASVIKLRDLDGNATVENIVRGDMLSYSPLTRKIRALYVNANSDTSLTIVGDGESATATLGGGSTDGLAVGQKVLIQNSVNYTGEHEITGIPSSTTFLFSSDKTTTESGTLVGKTISLDESLIIEDTVDSSISFSTVGRFVPIEAPVNSFDLPKPTYVQHFDVNSYNNQSFIRSVMVQDNLYLTNGNDEVFKYDGVSLYRAGLFRWQPHLFASINTASSGKIALDPTTIAYTARDNNYFTVADEDRLAFPVGTLIEDSASNSRYTILDTQDDGTSSYIYVDRPAGTTTTGNLSRVGRFRYYFRLNAIDINDNVIASAVTGSSDFVVELGENASVDIRLVGMPTWDIYDYDRLEVQIYRTKEGQPGPFYRLTTLALNFDNTDGYIDYRDTASDDELITLDEVNTALYGSELGTTISEPIRAKYITSADNRLILSNLIDYPTIDLQLIQNSTGPVDKAALATSGNNRYLFRKDNLDTGTATNMIDRVAYQFLSTGAVTITPASDITSPSAGVLNIAETGHGLNIGDWCYLFHAAEGSDNNLDFAGWYQVNTVPDANNFRVLSSKARAGTSADVDRYITASAPKDVPVWLGDDGNYNTANGNSPSGTGQSYEFIAIRRLANAINSSMRQTDTSIAAQASFVPWIIGNAGNEFNVGQLVVRQPKILSTNLELQLPTLTGAFDVFGNNIKRAADASIGALSRTFPSRTIQSFVNYPEIFDAPTALQDSESLSAVDVNSADGQQITATIPFFGSSAFGASQQNSIVTVFKENSIYLYNTAAKAQSQPPIQRLETEGKGCTAPFSVASTKTGIMFANFTGIYKLNRNLTIDYVGKKIERLWQQAVNRDLLSLSTAHNFSIENYYKLSIPYGPNQTKNNSVFVYNYDRENQQGPGSWTRYDNHPATGWAALLSDSFFSTTAGEVFSVRRAGNLSDYRDDNRGINYRLLTRAFDFGDSSIRKTFGAVISHFRTSESLVSSISLRAGVNLKNELEATDGFTISASSNNSTNLSDLIGQKVVSIKASLPTRLGNYLQLEYSGGAKDSILELTGLDVRVSGMSSKGITQAAST